MTVPLIEVLFFRGCPHVDVALERAQAALRAAALPVDENVALVEVATEDEAVRCRFTGSPTVRVRGEDVEDVEGRAFALQCRVYVRGGRLDGAPPVDWIVAALRGQRPEAAPPAGSDGGCCSGGESSTKSGG